MQGVGVAIAVVIVFAVLFGNGFQPFWMMQEKNAAPNSAGIKPTVTNVAVKESVIKPQSSVVKTATTMGTPTSTIARFILPLFHSAFATTLAPTITPPSPPPTPPDSLTGLTATATSTSQINLSWITPIGDGGSPVSGYDIERSTDGGTSWSSIVSNTGSTATTYSDTGLSSATQYTYRVSAINSIGTSSPSGTASATTLTQTLPSDGTFSLVPVSKAVNRQTCQPTGSKGWICTITTTYVQPPSLGTATVYLEQASETSLGSITDSGIINNIPRDTDIKIIVSGGFQPITKLIHTPVSQTNYAYTCTVDGCNFTP